MIGKIKAALLFTSLLLAGCNGSGWEFTDAQRDEIMGIASDVAADPDELETLRGQVAELEERVSELSAPHAADDLQRTSDSLRAPAPDWDSLSDTPPPGYITGGGS